MGLLNFSRKPAFDDEARRHGVELKYFKTWNSTLKVWEVSAKIIDPNFRWEMTVSENSAMDQYKKYCIEFYK